MSMTVEELKVLAAKGEGLVRWESSGVVENVKIDSNSLVAEGIFTSPHVLHPPESGIYRCSPVDRKGWIDIGEIFKAAQKSPFFRREGVF